MAIGNIARMKQRIADARAKAGEPPASPMFRLVLSTPNLKPMTPFRVMFIQDIPIRYRPDSSDESIIEEVITRRSYRRARIGFDVEKGEQWLDLGANIGAFGVYAHLRGAVITSYEPDEDNYNLLSRNLQGFSSCVRAAVTTSRAETVQFWNRRKRRGRFSPKGGLFHRGTTCASWALDEPIEVPNVFAGTLGVFDGVKMDIEGSEGPILDERLVPVCEKLCFEYHATIDKSTTNLKRRLEYVKDVFKVIHYQPELDRLVESGGAKRTFMDRTIWCMGRK